MDTSPSTVTKPLNLKRKSTSNNPKTILFRKYTAKGTTCLESAINDLVARVRLERHDYSDFRANKMKYVQAVSSRKPQKRKLIHQMDTNVKRIRMNHNITDNSKKIRMSMNAKMKMTPLKTNSETAHLNTDRNKHYFNGDKRQIAISSPRVRKPNPKFQDFITSSQIRLNTTVADKQLREKGDLTAGKPKSKLLKTAILIPEKDPLELMNSNFTEATGDDVVRSFLPVIDIPKVLYDSDSSIEMGEDHMMHNSKAKKTPSHTLPQNNETFKILNAQSVTPIAPKLNQVDPSQLVAPTQLTTNTSIILAPHTMTPVLLSPQVPLIIATNFAPAFNNISTPIIKDVSRTDIISNKSVINNGTQKKQSIQLPLRTYADKKATKKHLSLEEPKQPPAKLPLKTNTEKKSVKKNISPEAIKKKDTTRYYLVESEGVSNRTKTSKANNVDFNKLVRTLKSVKLPAANWKIRIVVSRSQTITEVTFTNKEVNERCVKFSRFFTGYVLTFGKSIVKLIGAPNKITCYEDVTTLLDIVHHLTLSDPVLEYVGDKDK